MLISENEPDSSKQNFGLIFVGSFTGSGQEVTVSEYLYHV